MKTYTYLYSLWICPLFVYTVTAADFNLVCPSGWTKIYEKCYIAVPTLHSWLEADDYCQKYGGRLSKSTGYLINDLVSDLFNSSSADYWIGYNTRGLSDRSQGLWSDGTGTTVEVGVWGDFEPNTPMGTCTRVSKSTNNKWYMESCDRLLPSVCELLPCPDNTFRCTTTGRCIGSVNICNGHDDCGDNSDERNCLKLPWTTLNNVTDCKFYISGTEGEVSMPTSGSQYSASSTCLWTIEAPVGKRIQIQLTEPSQSQFTQFNTERDLDVVEFFDGSPALKDGRCLTRLSGSLPESYQVFLSSNNFMNVRFTSDSSRQESGFKFTWRTNFQCQITKIANKRYRMGQLGDQFTLNSNDDYTRCQSECAEGGNALTCMGFSYNKVNNSCYLLKEVAQPVDDNCCDLYVKTCPESQQTGYPVLDNIPSEGGTRVGTSYNQYIYSPLYPVYYPGDLEISWIIQSSGTNVVTVEVQDIELCGSDTVVFKDGDNPITPTLKTLTSSSKVGEVILSTGNRMYVYMNLKEHMKCRGVLLAYRAGCNFEIKANTGMIFSPGYGVVNYPGVLECFWSISSLNGRTVRLIFDQFNLENNDFVKVWYGDNDRGVPVHSGNGYFTKPPLITSDSGKLAVKFTTSAVENRSGFNASFITTCLVLSDVSYDVDPVRNIVLSGDTVRMTCKPGFTFQAPYAGEANVALTCQPDGEYDKTIPVCSQAFCGLVPSITNGYVLFSSGLSGGDQVRYTCSNGYSVAVGTDLTITCQSNSLWETTPSCTATSCGALSLAVTNGRRQIISGSGTSHGSIAEYSCDNNYELVGPARIECKNGAWSANIPYCQRIRCPPQFITNGTTINTGVLYVGDNVTVNCNTGFEVNGISPYKCGIDIAPTCQNVDECTAGTATCNQQCVDFIGGYYCTCNTGYKISSSNPSICEDIDECAYNNGQCDHSCIDTNGSYNCTCNFGYSLYEFNGFQGLDLQPGEDGSKPWHSFHIGHSCVLKQCSQPPQIIANGRSLSLQLTFVQGDSLQYLCEVGYVIQGSNSATTTISCQGDGTWNPVIPTCVAATCFLDVTADSRTTPSSSISYGNSYSLVCDSTNSTGITLRRYCSYLPSTKRYGTVGDTLQCPLINCGIPTQISGSNTFSYSCTTIGCNFIFSCQGTYQLVGASSSSDTVVRCGVDGRWDVGDLRCISPLCTDPGTPPDALQVSTTYEIGAEVTYQCTRVGFAPSPSTPLRCVPFGSTAVWSPPTIPNCVDVTAPIFSNCFTQNFTVELYKAPNHLIPTATDQSGYVSSISTTPSNYRPTHIVPNSLFVTYTARDLNNNLGTCSFRVNVKDQVPPAITCSTPQAYVITSESSTISVDPKTLVLNVETGATLTANSGTFTLTSSDVGRVRMITLTAVDAAMNTQSCTVQVFTRVQNRCQPWILKSSNAVKTCTAKSGGNGYDCTFTCQSGYYFSNAVNSLTISTSCFTNGDWTTYPGNCVARNPAYYRQSFVVRYGTGTLSDPTTCANTYQTQLQNQWNTMASNLATMCRNNQPGFSISVSPPVDSTVSRLSVEYNNGIVYATFTFDMTPADYIDTAYQTCANSILNAFVNKQTELNPILSLSSSGSCPVVPTSSVSYDRTLKNALVCTTNAGVQYVTGESKSACFDCPLGYYSNEKRQCLVCGQGFYSASTNRDSCDACPSGTNSKKTGLTRLGDCYLSCPNGFISTTGEAPCYQCAADSYSSNGQSCTSCFGGRKTIGVGKSTASDCKNPCSPGYYSYNGLEVCTACPRNFYQATSGQTQCLECASNQVTMAEGNTSPADCINGFASVCTSKCLNGGTCQVVNHDYSCTCPPGYTGNACENTINPCSSQPCYNGGQCTQTGLQTYNCTCTSNRFTGDRCEHDINDCDFASNFNPCNNGSCHDLIGGYTCLCPSFSGFTGSTCATPRNPCVDSPCTNGQCQSANTIRRKCVCPPGYTGNACETNIDECVSSPCVNGGSCIDGVNNFVCSCPSGYSGTFCHVRGSSNVCAGKCGSGQTCVDYYPESKPFCMCPNGYNDTLIADGGSCQLENFCGPTSCLHGGQCISSYGGYICKCATGYSGPSCQFIVNNCANDPCLNQGVCINDVNSYQCNCPLTGTGGSICIDNKDNCNPYPCVIDNTIQCHDRINDYYCQCKPGFRGKNCSAGATDCQSFPCLHGSTCVITSTGYQCNCATGWYGNNCQNRVDNCDPASPCKNGAQCFNTVQGYQCVCPPGYRGDTCQIDYNLCNITEPCVGPNSTCSLTNGQPSCDCAAGYQGDTCNQRTITCTLSTCKNGGTCMESAGAVTCECVPGFAGTDCGTNIDECASNPCPTAGRCIDGVNMYTCQCNDGKIGPNCDKDLSYNFDIMVEPGLMCGDIEGISEISVFNLATTKLSVALWTRFTTTSPKVIMSLYATDSVTGTPEKILEVSSDRVLGSINSNTFSLPFGTGNNAKNIHDGLWHHIVVTWNALNAENQPANIGRVFLYVDNTLIQQQDQVATSYSLPALGYLVIGGTYNAATKTVSTTNGITGKISRLIIAKEEFSYTNVINSLYNNVNFLPTNNIINTPITYLIESGPMLIDYQSELSAGICRTSATCNRASSFPTSSCPIDQYEISPTRVSSPNFTEATFSGLSSVHYNIRSGDTMTWGTYNISSVAYTAENNAAVCVFRFYNKRESCVTVSPGTPTNGVETCSNPSPNTERCTIQCTQVDNKPSQSGPYFYTCSKYGMFDQAERLEPFTYPACTAAISKTLNVQLKLKYKLTTACESSKTTLQSEIRSKFTGINTLWQRQLCNAVNCESIPVSIDCASTADANVEVLFNTVTDPMINTQSVSRTPQDVISINVADNNALALTSATPEKTSMEIILVPYCVEGQQIVGNYCVSCAPGSYYDSNTAKCALCPIGQYQSSTGQSSCVSCPSGQTTYNTGAQSSSDCYESCSAGMYYSLSPPGTGNCVFCPVGFYQPSSGSFHCLPCGVSLTTSSLGTTQPTSCVDPLTITVAPTGAGSIGQSTTGGGLSGGEIAAIILAVLLFLLLLIFLILCCCRDRLPCFSKGMVEPEDKTPFKYVNRYGEPELNFTSYRLHDIREKRGKLPIIRREPVYHASGADDTRSIHTDISVQVPVFLEKLDGSVSDKRTFMNDTARSQISDQGMDTEVRRLKKRTKKKKRKVPRPSEYEENIYDEIAAKTSTPRALAPVITSMPKPLKPNKHKTPSEASFATASARSRTDLSTSGVYSNGDVRKYRKEKTIKIDSDNEDWR